jgi:GH15 family glucan-1,4-alpha-glucosidase
MWLLVRGGHHLYGETWRAAQALADHVSDRWRDPDAGLWEVRGAPAHYVHSKLMAWLALDRALRIAETHGVRAARGARWARERDAIAADVRAHGTAGGRFTRAYGQTGADAALLVLPLIGFEPRDSPAVVATVQSVRRELSAGGPLLFRYEPGDDRLPGDEGAFLPCSFWLVQALAATGAIDEAHDVMDQLLRIPGPLGLFAEEVEPATGAQIGNYPQAFTHATLVQAALAIRDATTPAAADRGRSRRPHGRPS